MHALQYPNDPVRSLSYLKQWARYGRGEKYPNAVRAFIKEIMPTVSLATDADVASFCHALAENDFIEDASWDAIGLSAVQVKKILALPIMQDDAHWDSITGFRQGLRHGVQGLTAKQSEHLYHLKRQCGLHGISIWLQDRGHMALFTGSSSMDAYAMSRLHVALKASQEACMANRNQQSKQPMVVDANDAVIQVMGAAFDQVMNGDQTLLSLLQPGQKPNELALNALQFQSGQSGADRVLDHFRKMWDVICSTSKDPRLLRRCAAWMHDRCAHYHDRQHWDWDAPSGGWYAHQEAHWRAHGRVLDQMLQQVIQAYAQVASKPNQADPALLEKSVRQNEAAWKACEQKKDTLQTQLVQLRQLKASLKSDDQDVVLRALMPETNVMQIHCSKTWLGQYRSLCQQQAALGVRHADLIKMKSDLQAYQAYFKTYHKNCLQVPWPKNLPAERTLKITMGEDWSTWQACHAANQTHHTEALRLYRLKASSKADKHHGARQAVKEKFKSSFKQAQALLRGAFRRLHGQETALKKETKAFGKSCFALYAPVKTAVGKLKAQVSDVTRELKPLKAQYERSKANLERFDRQHRKARRDLLSDLTQDGRFQQIFLVRDGQLTVRDARQQATSVLKKQGFIVPQETCEMILKYGDAKHQDILLANLKTATPITLGGYFVVLMPMLSTLKPGLLHEKIEDIFLTRISALLKARDMVVPKTAWADLGLGAKQKTPAQSQFLDLFVEKYGSEALKTQYDAGVKKILADLQARQAPSKKDSAIKMSNANAVKLNRDQSVMQQLVRFEWMAKLWMPMTQSWQDGTVMQRVLGVSLGVMVLAMIAFFVTLFALPGAGLAVLDLTIALTGLALVSVVVSMRRLFVLNKRGQSKEDAVLRTPIDPKTKPIDAATSLAHTDVALPKKDSNAGVALANDDDLRPST